jgi:signal transduction histidine kinase/CheY-like chemotaxis protein
VSQQLVVYRDAGGQPCAFSFIARDIAKARLAAAAERNALASDFQARKHESLERLSGGVAHQFNNLLTAVIGNTSLARIDVPQESGVHARLIASERAAMKAAELCKSLLLFSGGGRPPLGEASLNAIILAAEPGLQALGGSRVSVICSLDPGLGAVSANAQKIELALRELVRNAIESYGGRAGTVYLRTTRQQPEASLLRTPFHASEFKLVECAVIEIRDEGAGMSATTQERLFEPFFSTKHGHNGLGLSVVLGVVRSHGGAVEALSEPGRGTCFRLYFPIPRERQFAAPSEAAPEPKAEEWRNSGQVLVVDDEESVRVVATYMLESLGFTPFVAKDGMEGVKLFRQHNPSLRAVLLDLSMPMMDGEEAFGEMRRINADTPILIMSGYSQKEMTVRFKGCDPAGFLNKPFTFEDLRGAMRRALVREGPSRGADSR